jgi:hypothetical protein
LAFEDKIEIILWQMPQAVVRLVDKEVAEVHRAIHIQR